MHINSKLAKVVAASTLGATALVGLGASPVAAGCGASVEVHNLLASGAYVDWDDSDVRTSTMVFSNRVAGPWKRLGGSDQYIGAGATGSRAFTLDLSCNIDRQYRLEIEQGGSTWFEYFPSQTGWTRDITPHAHID